MLSKKLTRELIFTKDIHNDLEQTINQNDIKKIIPHRDPFLFLDTIQAINLEKRLIKTARWIDNNDPVFEGHFPNNPIYPGVFQGEIMFQSAAALLYFLINKTNRTPETYSAIDTVTTRIEAAMISPVRPNNIIEVHCFISEYDDLLVNLNAQCVVNNKICSAGSLQLYVV